MYARLTTIVFAPTEQDPAASVFERILPLVQELDGFRGMLLLTGLQERSLAALTLWATQEALDGAEPMLEGIKRAETSHRQVKTKQTVRFQVAGWQLSA
jgi:heme-degrading monooxygenase HmoA